MLGTCNQGLSNVYMTDGIDAIVLEFDVMKWCNVIPPGLPMLSAESGATLELFFSSSFQYAQKEQ